MASVRKRSWSTSKGESRSAWVVDFVDAAGNRGRRQFETKREADAFRVDIEGQLRAGTFRPDANKITIGEIVEEYLVDCAARQMRGERMTRATLSAYRSHARHIIQDGSGIAAIKAGQLSTRGVNAFRDRLRNHGMSPMMARKVLLVLRLAIDHAIGRDVLAVNAAAKVRVVSRRDEDVRRVTPPSREALLAVMAVADENLRAIIQFAAASGLRASELWALRWRDLDLDEGAVTVEGRVDQFGEYEPITKSRAGRRIVPLGDATVASLKRWRIRSKWSRAEDLLFPNSRGRYQSHSNFLRRKFSPILTKAGEAFEWHSLRHFAISSWIDASLAPKTVQTFAGHSSLQVTMDRYGHLFPSADHRRAMDAIAEGLLG